MKIHLTRSLPTTSILAVRGVKIQVKFQTVITFDTEIFAGFFIAIFGNSASIGFQPEVTLVRAMPKIFEISKRLGSERVKLFDSTVRKIS